jgi:hypothetical protein
MKKTLFKCAVLWAVTVACLSTMINSASAGAFTRGCAARDLQILMVIEERESTNAISAEKLSDALLNMMDARLVCYEGRVVDALAIYDSIVSSITPSDLQFGRLNERTGGVVRDDVTRRRSTLVKPAE